MAGSGMGAGTGEGEGGGARGGGGGAGIFWAVLWFLGLWFFAWPVSLFIAWFYIILLPFSACVDPLKDLCEALLKLLQLPLTFAEKMVAMEPCC